jgi:hypothetical protein
MRGAPFLFSCFFAICFYGRSHCAQGKGFVEIRDLFSYGLSHCAFGARSRFVFDALSLSFHKERAKEKELGRSLRDLPASRRFKINGGAFAFGKRPPSAGHISNPADGLALARAFAVSQGPTSRRPAELVQTRVRGRWQKLSPLLVACALRVGVLSSKRQRKI